MHRKRIRQWLGQGFRRSGSPAGKSGHEPACESIQMRGRLFGAAAERPPNRAGMGVMKSSSSHFDAR